jgi:bacterioferritin-associated ferredoxin
VILMELDDKLCYCFHVTKRKVMNFIRIHKPRRASQVSECGGAGTGCGWCVPFLKQCFEQGSRGEFDEVDAVMPADYARLRAAYILAGKGKPPPGATPIVPASDADTGDVNS